jgi:hypothetical protein
MKTTPIPLLAMVAAAMLLLPPPADGGELGTATPRSSAAPVLEPSAAPAATPAAAPWIPPADRSPRPKPGEWATAEPLPLPRPGTGCHAARLREWVNVICEGKKYQDLMGARIIGGSHEEVSLESPPRDPGDAVTRVSVVFPVRRGDRRLIEIPESVFVSYSMEEQAVAILSELWLPGDQAPTITVH